MDTEFRIEDVEGDTVSFIISDSNDLVAITIPFNEDTMVDNATVVLDKQDIARLVEKLNLPEVYYE